MSNPQLARIYTTDIVIYVFGAEQNKTQFKVHICNSNLNENKNLFKSQQYHFFRKMSVINIYHK